MFDAHSRLRLFARSFKAAHLLVMKILRISSFFRFFFALLNWGNQTYIRLRSVCDCEEENKNIKFPCIMKQVEKAREKHQFHVSWWKLMLSYETYIFDIKQTSVFVSTVQKWKKHFKKGKCENNLRGFLLSLFSNDFHSYLNSRWTL